MVELASWLGVGDFPVWSVLLAVAIVLIYVDWRVTFSLFTNLGIPGPWPWPLVGQGLQVAIYGILQSDLEWSRQYGKVYGYFRGRRPFLVVRDPELLQTILVKDFANFRNRGSSQLVRKPIDKSVLFLRDDDWREVRAVITPTFSSGKLKQMFQLVNNCAENLAEGFVKTAKSGNLVKVKELFGAYTIDVIAVTAFGLNINSFRNPENLFLKNVKKSFEFRHRPVLNFVDILALSPLFEKIVTKLVSWRKASEPLEFFSKIVLSTMDERKALNGHTQRVDFLQLLMNAEADNANTGSTSKDSRKRKLTSEEIVAQAFLFFLAGYETTASTLQYLAHNLAMHPEFAEKVHREIDDTIGDDEPSYESMSRLVYLEQCLNETLRLHSPVHTMLRTTGNDVKLGQYRIPRGTLIQLPYYGIHHDPDFYPNPHEFNPERFSPSAKASRHPMTFSPFGQGPRICIGMRLALMEAKIAMVHVLRRVRLTRCPEAPGRLTFLPVNRNLLVPSKPVVVRPELRETI